MTEVAYIFAWDYVHFWQILFFSVETIDNFKKVGPQLRKLRIHFPEL